MTQCCGEPPATVAAQRVDNGAGQNAETRPLLVVEHCVLRVPLCESELPELELGTRLDPQLHCYAHGGFMGLAISLLADRTWRHIFMDDLGDKAPVSGTRRGGST